jgi:hypothetical protein
VPAKLAGCDRFVDVIIGEKREVDGGVGGLYSWEDL